MDESSRQTVLASVVLTLCLVSDSLLYLLLPLYFDDFGLAFIWVGILLSVNRLIRIALQTWLVTWYEKLGVRNTLFLSVILSGVACSFFAMGLSVYWLILARLMWGIAYSLMRMCCLFLATENPDASMKRLGWYTSLQEAGPLCVLMLAPWLMLHMSPQSIMIVPLILCFLALIPTFMVELKATHSATVYITKQGNNKKAKWLPEWNVDHAITLMLSMLYDGAWIVVLATLLTMSGTEQQQTITIVAALLVLRRAFNLLLGFVFVRFTSNVNNRHLINLSIITMLVAGVLIYLDQIVLGSVIAIGGRGFYMLLMPKALSDESTNSEDKKHAVNAFTIWRDIASAIGSFLAGLLLYWNVVQAFFLLMTIVIFVVLIKQFTSNSSNTFSS